MSFNTSALTSNFNFQLMQVIFLNCKIKTTYNRNIHRPISNTQAYSNICHWVRATVENMLYNRTRMKVQILEYTILFKKTHDCAFNSKLNNSWPITVSFGLLVTC